MNRTSERLGLMLSACSFIRDPDASSGALGSRIAGLECCRALIRYASGRETCLFTRERDEATARSDLAQLREIDQECGVSVPILPVSDLGSWLGKAPLTALHDPREFRLDAMAHARWSFAGQIFPITSMAYSTSQQYLLQNMVSGLLLAPTYPCDSVVCTTQVAKRTLTNTLGRLREELGHVCGEPPDCRFQVNVVPYGVPVDIFKPRDRADIRKQLELPASKVIVLYAGRLDPTSKMDVNPLLLAFRGVISRHPGRVVLVLVGPATKYMERLQTALAELGLRGHVLHRANVPKVSVPLYYSAADIFVSLSDTLQENFGLTPVEAMASGLPVVVSDWAGYQETVVHGRTGFKVPTYWAECDEDLCMHAPFYEWTDDLFYTGQSIAVDVEATATYLNLLVSDQARRLEMGQAARQHVLGNFSWERVVEQMWELWLELSQVARALTPQTERRGNLVQPRYFRDFAEFASERLDGSARLQLSRRGSLVCARKEPLLLISDPRRLLRPDLVHQLLRVLSLWGRLRQSPTFQQLEELMGKRGVPATATRRHLMWLLKYDLAVLVKG